MFYVSSFHRATLKILANFKFKPAVSKVQHKAIIISLLSFHKLNLHLFPSCIINASSYSYWHLILFRFFFFVLTLLRYRDIKVFCFTKRRKKKYIRQKQLNDIMSWNQLQINWKWKILTLIWITLMKGSLCLEGS